MVSSLIVTVILIASGLLVLHQSFNLVKNETVRMLLMIAYGLFTVSMLFIWFADSVVNKLFT